MQTNFRNLMVIAAMRLQSEGKHRISTSSSAETAALSHISDVILR